MSLNISAVLIARDAEQTIGETLASLSVFPEVVVYDNGSTDRTIEVARSFPNVVLYRGTFAGFGPTKNLAVSHCSNDWVFSIDSDEVVTAALVASLQDVDLGDPATAYAVRRHNYFMGREVRHSGWNQDWLVRLFNRRTAGFSDAPVHEKVLVPEGGKVVRLDGELKHRAVDDLSDFLVKINRYSELRRNQPLRTRSLTNIALRTFWAFFRTFVVRLGFLDGWRGLVIAYADATGVFFKFMKPYADHRLGGRRSG